MSETVKFERELVKCTHVVMMIMMMMDDLGFVHPLQDVALHQCLSLSSFCCFPVLGGSLLPWSSS